MRVIQYKTKKRSIYSVLACVICKYYRIMGIMHKDSAVIDVNSQAKKHVTSIAVNTIFSVNNAIIDTDFSLEKL